MTARNTPLAASRTYQAPCAGWSARTIATIASASAPAAVASAPITFTASACRGVRASTATTAVRRGSARTRMSDGSITEFPQQPGVAGSEVLVDLGAERGGDRGDDDEVEHEPDLD